MKNTMSTAWEIRKAAGIKWNCDKMEIVFGMCLEIAHKGEKIMGTITIGSEKQIAWAKTIKVDILECTTPDQGIDICLEDTDMAIMEKFHAKAKKCEDAVWFIENRGVTCYTFDEIDEDDIEELRI